MTHMPSEQSSDSKFEIGHVLFIDIVGYSKLLIEEQKERLGQPTKIVSSMLSYGALKLFPVWDPLRGDPRFEKIVASLAPKDAASPTK